MKRSALRMSLVAIVSVFIFEFTAGLLTNSLALITDSTHALLDAVVTAILIIAVRLALKPKDGPLATSFGRYTVTFVKSDGQWFQIVRHFSLLPPEN